MKDLTKRVAIRSDAIRKAAEDECCTWPGCGVQDKSVVFANSNMSIHGKAGGRKAEDVFGAFLCGSHHSLYDVEPRGQASSSDNLNKEWHFMRAMSATWLRLISLGIITVKGMK